MKNLILTFIIMFSGYSASAQIYSPSNKFQVNELVNLHTGQGVLMDEMIESINSEISDDKKEAFKNEMKGVLNNLLEKTADAFIEVFNEEEINAMLEFYDTPIGQQIKMKMPEFIKKSTILGEEISMDFMPIIEQYMH